MTLDTTTMTDPVRMLDLDPADAPPPRSTRPVNPEPAERIRPLDLDAVDAPTLPRPRITVGPTLEERRAAHGVTRDGLGRGTSNQKMGRNRVADQYCQARQGIQSAREARELFGLDWRVSLQDMQLANRLPTGESVGIASHRAVVREDTGEVLSVVGSRYTPLQNDALDILDAIRDEAPIVRGGVWDGGRRVWLQTALGTLDTPSGPMEGTALAATSHDASLALTFTAGGIVVVCRNTFRRNLAAAPSSISIRHTAGAARGVERMREALTAAKDNLRAMGAEMMSWGRTKVSPADLQRFVAAYLPAPAPKAGEKDTGKRALASHAERVSQWHDAYRSAPGAMPGTVWGVAMATTYYADHIRAVRSGTDKMERAWTDSGTERALQTVSVLAGASA